MSLILHGILIVTLAVFVVLILREIFGADF